MFGLVTNVFGPLETRHGVPSPMVPLGLVGLVLGGWNWQMQGRPRRHPATREVVIAMAALIGFGLARAISLLAAVDVGAGWVRTVAWGKDLVVVGGLVATTWSLRHGRWLLWTVTVGLASLAVPTLVLLALDSHRDLGGYITFEIWSNQGGRGWLPAGPIGDANDFARQMLVVVPVAWFVAATASRPAFRVAAALVTASGVAAVLSTRSRGAMVAMALMGLVALVPWAARRGRLVPLVGAALVVGVGALVVADRIGVMKDLGEVRAYVGGEVASDSSAAGHASTFRAGLRMWADHPLIGVGTENWSEYYLPIAAELGIDSTGRDRAPHNIVVELLAETGVVGLLAFGAMTVAVLRVSRSSAVGQVVRLGALGFGLTGMTVGLNHLGTLLTVVALALVSPLWRTVEDS